MVAANSELAVAFSLSPGNSGGVPEGRKLLKAIVKIREVQWSYVLMDRAYEGNEIRALAFTLGFNPVVPAHPNRCQPWLYNKALYKKRNEIGRLFGYLKRFRRVCTRYDKLDVVYMAFVTLALIFDLLK